MKQEYPYIFTLIMAVYNVELYLKEAIESVIAQSIGIDRITVEPSVTPMRPGIRTIFL